ncbi:MAG: phage tail protein [Oscillospiraceae bacterium]|nr:phage tail protein [Oscillospiraceae bacterium]
MYRVTIYNGDTATIIHEPSMNRNDPHLPSCSLVQGCSGEIDSLTFTILPDNPGFDLLNSRTTMISVHNVKNDTEGNAIVDYAVVDEAIVDSANVILSEFVGRVLTVTPQMDESGLISKTVICEDRLGFLCDSVQPYTAEATYRIEDFWGLLLSQHNAQVEPYKQINLGTVAVTTGSGNVTKGLNYQTTWDAISEKLLKSLGGEIRLYSLDGKLYLDYVQELGERSPVTIALGKNIKSISREIDPTNVITRLIPLGATADQGGGSSEGKVTISSVNDGCIYLDDDAAIDIYGIVVGTVEWPDVTDPGNLLTKAKAWLEAQTFEERIALSALDLSVIGLDLDAIERYNYYRVVCDPIGLDTYMRVVKRTLDVVNPLDTTYELGQRSRSVLASTGSAAQQSAEEAAAQAQAQALKTIQTLLADGAYLNQLFVLAGIIANDISAVTINASKYITGVTILGDLIQANTLSAKKIILEGSDGLFYELNAKAGTLTAEQLTDEQYQQRLDGSVLVKNSITADKINVTDLIALGATIGGWEIREDGLYKVSDRGTIALRPLGSDGCVIEVSSTDDGIDRHFTVNSWGLVDATQVSMARAAFAYLNGSEAGALTPNGLGVGDGIKTDCDFIVQGKYGDRVNRVYLDNGSSGGTALRSPDFTNLIGKSRDMGGYEVSGCLTNRRMPISNIEVGFSFDELDGYVEESGFYTTFYVPCKAGDVIRGSGFWPNQNDKNVLSFWDVDFNCLGRADGTVFMAGGYGISVDTASGSWEMTIPATDHEGNSLAKTVYFRLSFDGVMSQDQIFVITANEEISYTTLGPLNRSGIYLGYETANSGGFVRNLVLDGDGNVDAKGRGSFGSGLSVNGFPVPRIQHGRVSVTAAPRATTEFSVTFTSAFPGTPDVTLTPRHNSSTRLFCKLKTASANGFTADIYNDTTSTSSGHVAIHWMAMY